MHALVVGAAPVPASEDHYRALLARVDLVVAADAAGEWCVSLGRVPDVAVGDFDSAEAGAPERLAAAGVEVVRFPAAKDASDLDLAVTEARLHGATRLTITAAARLRLDHTLAALGTLAGTADLAGELDEPGLAAWPVDDVARPRLELEGPAGAIVSVFSVGGTATGVTLAGFTFPLVDAAVPPLSSLGLSNTLTGAPASIAVGSGTLIVIAEGAPGARPSVRSVTLG